MALSYGARQTCYIVRGKVTATATAAASAAEGSPENGRRVEFGAGDIVVFPKGTRCTWHIAAAVDMHYAFDPSSMEVEQRKHWFLPPCLGILHSQLSYL